MNILSKKSIGLLLLISLLIGLVGCTSSSDPLADATKLFSTISRIERQNPGGMQFTEDQANKQLEIINPVLSGLPFTSDLAKQMLKEMDKLLTKEQKAIIDNNSSISTTQGQGGGSGGGVGGGTGMNGSGIVPSSENFNGANLFLRLDEIITNNYLAK